LSPRDVTPEALKSPLERSIAGMEEAINAKLKTSGGMDTLDKFKDPSQHEKKQKYDL